MTESKGEEPLETSSSSCKAVDGHLIDVAITKMNAVESALTQVKRWTSYRIPTAITSFLYRKRILSTVISNPWPSHSTVGRSSQG